ncbi:MAG: hypothetical protein K2X27_22245 [Candidatus Obscuribacterales bacterium]|nr:hypothetical protein [Candidatus Obscuribacterales bacterium]
MKLSSVVLLSVNLVAASQVAANAADTASFLQDALDPSQAASSPAPLKAARAASHSAARSGHGPRKRSSSKNYVAMTPVIDGVKVRPFVPGRYLPSESELQTKKQEAAARQTAYRLDNSAILSGQVSANNNLSDFSSSVVPAAAYAMSKPANQAYIHKVAQVAIQKVKQAARNYSASRSVAGINPVLPGQIAQLPGAPSALPDIPEPRAASSMPVQVPQPMQHSVVPVTVPPAPRNIGATTCVVPPPMLSKYESSQLEKLVDNNMPENVYAQSFNGDTRASVQGNPGLAGAGPPPFPLSTIPINAGRGRGINTVGAQARFGSWHGGHSNLPQASFHSFVPIHMAGPMSVKVNHYSSSHKTGRQAHSASRPQAQTAAVKKSANEKPKAAPYIASYAPYQRYSSCP